MSDKAKKIIRNIAFLLICIVIAYALSNFLFTTIEVDGISMETTLHDGDRVLLFKPGKYQYGDIIVFNSHKMTSNGERYLVKRIIGMPGDTVEVILDDEDGRYYVWRNGVKLKEDYTNSANIMREEMARVTVPDGKFLYMGDNRDVSADSRRTGECGDMDAITGRVILRYVIEKGKSWDMQTVKRIKA